MKISAKAEYGCLAALALARVQPEEPPLRIREIAESEGIPERYLVQILLQLKGAGIVASTRGASGGYRLASTPDRITVADLLTAIDGPLEQPVSTEPTSLSARALRDVWRAAREAELRVLERTTLAGLVDRTSPREWVI